MLIGGIPWKSGPVGLLYTLFMIVLVQFFGSLSIIIYSNKNINDPNVGASILGFTESGLHGLMIFSAVISGIALLSVILFVIGYSLVSFVFFIIKTVKQFKNQEEKKETNEEEEEEEDNRDNLDVYEKKKLQFDKLLFFQRIFVNCLSAVVILEIFMIFVISVALIVINPMAFGRLSIESIAIVIVLLIFVGIFIACFSLFGISSCIYGLLTNQKNFICNCFIFQTIWIENWLDFIITFLFTIGKTNIWNVFM